MKSTLTLRTAATRLFGWWLVLVVSAAHAGEDSIKVGILHSLSGTMAISESVLKDTVLMLIEDQNKKGGVLGRKLEPVIVDPASEWNVFAEKARELLTKEKVAVVFGCWTSASRKSVLPIFEQLNSLLGSPDFRVLSGGHGGLIRRDSKSFAAEIPKAGDSAQKLQWLDADGENPFPGSVANVVDWLKHFDPKDGKMFEYADYPDVCPSHGLRLLQPSVAMNVHP